MPAAPVITNAPQTPYSKAKFYKAMRHRLADMDLPASALGLLIGLHCICDADTGSFVRDDVTMRELLGMSKSTVAWAFKRLLKVGLVSEVGGGLFEISHYSTDRLEGNYFRIGDNLLAALPRIIAHHHPGILLFALQLLDQSRVHGAEIVYGMRTLVYKEKLGSCPARVMKALDLLDGITKWAALPNSSGTGDNLYFYINNVEPDISENTLRFRALHGTVSRETKLTYEFVSQAKLGSYHQMTWRELSRTTRLIIQYGIDQNLTEEVLKRMASRFGALCAQGIKNKAAYLRKALPGLAAYVLDAIRKKLLWDAEYATAS